MAETNKDISFEEALSRLEKAAETLRSGSCSLEESVKIYEETVKYYDICTGILEQARQKIEIYRPQTGKTEGFDEQ